MLIKKRMDPKLVSMQWYERYWIRWHYGIPKDVLTDVIIRVGRSRQKIYQELRRLGYLNVPNIL